VCKKLSIQIIRAHSPQAKGRVERSNPTQSRAATTIPVAARLMVVNRFVLLIVCLPVVSCGTRL
jgi:hypothetical protein